MVLFLMLLGLLQACIPDPAVPCDGSCQCCGSDASVCQVCASSQYINGPGCVTCPPQCATCDSTTCLTCQSTCADCNMSVCNQCTYSNYYLDSSQQYCYSCPSQCSSCTSYACYSCFQTNYYPSGMQCYQCPTHCLTCTASTCQSCSAPCLTCDWNQCTTCLNSHEYPIGLLCYPCDDSCATCTQSQCLTCPYNDWYTLDKKCYPCEDTCLTCTSTTCLTCIKYNSYVSGKICLPCDDTCLLCNSTQCLTCPEINQYTLGNKCLNCDSSCSTCNSTNCLTCPESNYYVNGNICSQCPSHCLTCNSHTCFTCKGNCAKCDYTSCIGCISNQFYPKALTCINCEGNCSTCDQTGLCLSCPQPFTLVNNQCVFVCDQNCAICTQIECLTCSQPTYYPQGSTCVQCNSPCITCINKTSCLSCIENSTLNNNQCICNGGYEENNGLCKIIDCKLLSSRTIEYCKYQDCTDAIWEYGEQCDNGNQIGCINCRIDKGYICFNKILEPSSCLPIQPNCEKAIFQSRTLIICISCLLGYYLYENQCIACKKQCLTCNLQPSTCTTCRFSQISTETQCQLCEINLGYYSDFINNICSTICGDGIVAGTETCDIGSSSGLGCNNCQIEYGYLCSANNCQYQFDNDNCIYPSLNTSQQLVDSTAMIPDQSFSIYTGDYCSVYFNFSFQNMYKNNDLYFTFSQSLLFQNFTISNIMLSNYFDGNVTYNSSFSDKLYLYFNFTKSVTPQNIIYLFINFEQQNNNWSIGVMLQPNPQEVLSASQASTQQNIQTSTSTASMAVFVTLAITPLFGGFGFILKLMDIIAWLSTFYYINITYPYNVNLFLQTISFNSIFFMLPQLSTPLNEQMDQYRFTSAYKFMQNEVDPLFINNILQPAVFILSPIIIYFFTKVWHKFFPHSDIFMERNQPKSTMLQINNRQAEKMSIYKYKSQTNGLFHQTIKQISKQAYIYQTQIYSIVLQQIYINMLDIFMAAMLQLTSSPPNEYLVIKINSAIAIVTIIAVVGLLIQIYSRTQKHFLLVNTRSFRSYYESIYESLNIDTFEHRVYGCLLLYSKIIYTAALTIFYYRPILQTAFCTGTYFFIAVYILYSNPYQNLHGLLTQWVPNICVFSILSMTFLLAVNEQINFIEDIAIPGWIILGFISLSIGVSQYFYSDNKQSCSQAILNSLEIIFVNDY